MSRGDSRDNALGEHGFVAAVSDRRTIGEGTRAAQPAVAWRRLVVSQTFGAVRVGLAPKRGALHESAMVRDRRYNV